MTRLLLVRHGNTIPAGDPAIWVGGRTDMPLTPEGLAQADAVAKHISYHYKLDAIISGPLLRTRQTANPIAAAFGLTAQIDETLREIDYGPWEGLTNDAIAAQDAAALTAYQQHGIWPKVWGGAAAQAQLRQQLHLWLDQIAHRNDDTLCAVTSNGILRLIHELVTGNADGAAAKVKTGHFCSLHHDGTTWQVEAWNKKPN